MQARFAVTKKYAAAYESASKKHKGVIVDQTAKPDAPAQPSFRCTSDRLV